MRKPNRECNPRLSSLWSSSSTNCTTTYPTKIFLLITFHLNAVIFVRFCRKYADITHHKYNLPVCRHILWQKLCTGFRLNLVFAGQTVPIYLIMMPRFWLALGSGRRKILVICVETTIVGECQTDSRVTAVAAVAECLRTHPTPTPTHTQVSCADCHCW